MLHGHRSDWLLQEERPENKNYYWITEEKNGVKHNTLNYKKRVVTEDRQKAEDTPSWDDICQDNCCTLLLIFIIFVLRKCVKKRISVAWNWSEIGIIRTTLYSLFWHLLTVWCWGWQFGDVTTWSIILSHDSSSSTGPVHWRRLTGDYFQQTNPSHSSHFDTVHLYLMMRCDWVDHFIPLNYFTMLRSNFPVWYYTSGLSSRLSKPRTDNNIKNRLISKLLS